MWGASKTHPGTEEIKNLQKRIEVLNRAPPTQQNRSDFFKLVRSWMNGLESRKFIGPKDQGLIGLNMVIKIQKIFT